VIEQLAASLNTKQTVIRAPCLACRGPVQSSTSLGFITFTPETKLTYAQPGKTTSSTTHQRAEQRLDPGSSFVYIGAILISVVMLTTTTRGWRRAAREMKDDKHTELTVARDRVKVLKQRLQF